VVSVELVKITIDGKEVEVPAGISVLEAAERIGIHIPRLCHDPDLSDVGACRLCVVEVEGMRNLPASCVTIVTDGMVVRTNTDPVMEARKTILELLVANHPLDCLTCEKLGDCSLAEYCYQYGVTENTFINPEKHSYELEDSNPFFVRDLNKCIVCGRCIRACAEMTCKDIIDFNYRGFNTKVGPFGDTDMASSDCVYCGNCVAVCPTGALTEKQMQGKGRRWEYERVTTTCPFCGTGCNFDLMVKDGKIAGVTSNPNSPVNGKQLCIKGRFGWDFVHNEKRLTSPLVKKNGEFVPVSWDEAFDTIATRFNEIKEKYGGNSFAALSSARCTNEENYLVQKFTRAVMGTNNVDHCART
jgi:NADH-quinone oxidoreductase subunit G